MTLSTEWEHYTSIITLSATSTGGTLSLQGPSGSKIWVRNVKVEAGEIATPFNLAGDNIVVQDSSGYNHNGIIIGNPIISSSSARYGTYTSFDGSDDAINAGLDFEVEKAQNFTFCAWIYSDRWNTGVNDYFLSSQESGGFLIRTLSSNTIRVRVNAFTAADYSANSYIDADATLASIGVTTTGWHFVAGVYTTSDLKLYVDGVLRTTNTIATYGLHFNGSTNLFLGAECAGSNPTPFCKCGLSDVRIYYTALTADDILALYHTGAKIDNKQNLHTFELNETNTNLLSGILWCAPFSSHTPLTSPFTNYNSNGEPQFTSNSTSAGSDYIEISPTGHTYEYDYTISVNAGNQFYIGFERYDADKTARSNNACVYTFASKPSSDIVKQHYTGTINLATDGTNPCKYIALRVLNGWSGTTSGVTGTATIHSISLRQIGTKQQLKITKTGLCVGEELKEETNTKLHKNGIIETNNLIEL